MSNASYTAIAKEKWAKILFSEKSRNINDDKMYT
jgi:hypothetical protein